VKQVVASIAGAAAEQHTVIHFHCPEEPLYALVDPVQLAVAVRALGVNALESLDQGGRVVLAVCGVGADDEGRDSDNGQNDNLRSDNLHSDAVEITVVDNGPGISSEAAPRIFDPFFSGREAGRGLGFGLSKCWRIVTDHGGRIEARNNPDGGAAFTIRLPRVASAGDDVAQPATEVARPAAASLSAPMGHGEGAGSG
jgi:signal transduction histidine kinase